MKLYNSDFVRMKNGKLVESLDVIYHKTSLHVEELHESKIHGEIFVRMTELPKNLQKKYLNHFKMHSNTYNEETQLGVYCDKANY